MNSDVKSAGKIATQLSRLLACDACGSPLWMHHNGSREEPDRAIWRCPKCKSANIHHSQAIRQATAIIQNEIANNPTIQPPAERPPASSTLQTTALSKLIRQRDRLVDLYQDEALTKEEYVVRRRELDAQITYVQNELNDITTRTARAAERINHLRKLDTLVEGISNWMENEDPQTVNRTLTVLVEKFIVEGEIITKLKSHHSLKIY